MKLWKSIAVSAISLVALFLLFTPTLASAQSCALCYTQAASSGSHMIQALKSGILILIAPPTLMSVGLIFICYRKRNQTMTENGEESDLDWKDTPTNSDENW
ncbi:MAG: hypothetical protein WBM24_04825 [Candidatus Sulfotelmatobacter sp.]